MAKLEHPYLYIFDLSQNHLIVVCGWRNRLTKEGVTLLNSVEGLTRREGREWLHKHQKNRSTSLKKLNVISQKNLLVLLHNKLTADESL